MDFSAICGQFYPAVLGQFFTAIDTSASRSFESCTKQLHSSSDYLLFAICSGEGFN
jgi:hypothetical protein